MNEDLNPTHNGTTCLSLGTLILCLITNYELVIMLKLLNLRFDNLNIFVVIFRGLGQDDYFEN
ncbi:hypothetical protein NIES3275_16010 [Microchaete diplosiphon NIES-3275]|nr:hypothetical protein NIES3275_16010 [Microchaete diplosiphon NIES-3275]